MLIYANVLQISLESREGQLKKWMIRPVSVSRSGNYYYFICYIFAQRLSKVGSAQ